MMRMIDSYWKSWMEYVAPWKVATVDYPKPATFLSDHDEVTSSDGITIQEKGLDYFLPL